MKRICFLVCGILLAVFPHIIRAQDSETADPVTFCRLMDYVGSGEPAFWTNAGDDLGNPSPAEKSENPPEIGEERTFNVFEEGWITKMFQLLDKTSAYYLWMDVEEITNQIEFDLNFLRRLLMDNSPPRSINPDAGVLENTRTLYGEPPDFDRDGIVDILLYDIEDALGYVTFVDQSLEPPDGIGNKADVVYIATIPEEDLTASVIAHEFAHLIHFRYDADHTFIFEGLAEFSEVANGYEWYPEISYWQNSTVVQGSESPILLFDYQLPLFYWGSPENRDYQRANHFFTYLGEQFDPEMMGEILRNPLSQKGGTGLDAVLAERGTNLNKVLRDFHVANLVNDAAVDARFVHNRTSRTYNSVPITVEINGEEPTGFSGGTPVFRQSVVKQAIAPGSVRYVKWSDVSDFSFEYDANGFELVCSDPILLPLCDGKRAKLRNSLNGLLIGKKVDGSTSVIEIAPGLGTYVMNGDFEFIILALSHSDVDLFNPITWPENDPEFSYTAAWTPLSLSTGTESGSTIPVQPSLSSVFPNPFGSSTTVAFDVAAYGRLKMTVFDVLGRKVVNLRDEVIPAGSYTQAIDASAWPSGAYILVIQHPGRVDSRIIHKLNL